MSRAATEGARPAADVTGTLAGVLPAGTPARWGFVALAGLAALALGGLWSTPAHGASWWWPAGALTQGLAWWGAADAARRARVHRGADTWTTSLLFATGTCLLAPAVLLPVGLPVRVLPDLVWVGLAVALPVALVRYPHGRPRTPGERGTAALLLTLGIVGLDLGGVVGSLGYRTGELRGVLACAEVAVLAVCWWWRGEHADAETRVALLWPALGAGPAGLLVGHLLFVADPAIVPEPLVVVTALALGLLVPVSVAVGLVAPRVHDVRRLIGGLAVAVVMVDLTVGVVAGCLAALAWLTGAPATKNGVAVVATGCAVAFGPVLVRVRRITAEVLFGGSPDPVDTMSRLGAELGADGSPGAWVEALRSALVVPRVELRTGGQLLAAAGTGGGATESTALRAGGEHVGDLVVTVPAEATRLPRGTRAVLGLVAAPLARALQAVRLAEELHASRGRVVQAREEERRRLRRDLHDGLGPVLTGVAYTADAATNLLRSDAERAAVLLGQLRSDTADAISEIRRIVQGLRPPALDEVGLAAALRQHAVRYAGAARVDVRCTLAAADAPGRLPAALEVVAYRVAVEALTNAARHASPPADAPALHVTVDIAGEAVGAVAPAGTRAVAAAELVVTVSDDGTCARPWTTGTGLASMVARCDEVGGTLVAAPTATGGRVEARLPLGRTSAADGRGARPTATDAERRKGVSGVSRDIPSDT